MDLEVFDDVCAPSYAIGGLGDRLDESTDFFAMRTEDEAKQLDESTELKTPSKTPLTNLQNNILTEEKLPEVKQLPDPVVIKLDVENSICQNTTDNTADGSELENLGRLAMFGNRPQVKRRSQLRKEMENSKDSGRKAPVPTPVIAPPVRPVPSGVPNKDTPMPKNQSSISRSSSNDMLRNRRAGSADPIRQKSSVPAVDPLPGRTSLTGPVTRARARQSKETTTASAHRLSDKMSKLVISKPKPRAAPVVVANHLPKRLAPLPTEHEFRKGIHQRSAIAPRLSSTPVSKVFAAKEAPIAQPVKKPPVPVSSQKFERRPSTVRRSSSLKPVAKSPVVVARSPMRRTPIAPTAQSKVAFGSAIRRNVVSARRSAAGSPGFRNYPAPTGSTPRRVVTIPDTPAFLRRAPSLSRKDTPSRKPINNLPPSAAKDVASTRKSRIDVAQLVDRLSKPKTLTSPKRNPNHFTKVTNAYTHGLTSQRSKRSRSNSLVPVGRTSESRVQLNTGTNPQMPKDSARRVKGAVKPKPPTNETAGVL